MSLIKEVIDCFVEPFAYICNKSLSTGIFTDKMKTTKVILIFKGSNKEIVKQVDSYLDFQNSSKKKRKKSCLSLVINMIS